MSFLKICLKSRILKISHLSIDFVNSNNIWHRSTISVEIVLEAFGILDFHDSLISGAKKLK